VSNPFAKGNKEILSQARRNPILSDEDLIPTTFDNLVAEFDRAYYRTGSGIDQELITRHNDRKEKLLARMSGSGFAQDDIDLYNQFYNPYTSQPEILDPERFGTRTDERVTKAVEIHKQLLEKYPDIQTNEDITAEVKSFVKGEVQTADKIASKGDSLTLAFTGGFAGVLTDPSVLITMFAPLGQDVAIAKTGSMVSNILKRSAIEGALGATGEALSIPLQKQNRAFLDEEFTTWDAAKNIAMAGAGGFLLTALAKSGLDTYKYMKELKRGTDDAQKIITNNIDNTPANQAAVKYMDDVSYTANRALEGDEFPPMHGENITPEQYVKHMDDSRVAYEEAMMWGDFNKTGNYDELLPTARADVMSRVDDDSFYKELLTDADRAYDDDLFKQAEKIDVDVPVGTRVGEEGEIIIDTRTSRGLAKQLDNELSALEGISMCMRGRT
jgi:hypothetical protein